MVQSRLIIGAAFLVVVVLGYPFAVCTDDFSSRSHFYRVDYLKPAGGNPAVINAIFASRPNPEQAENFLREELERSVKYARHRSDIMAYAWVGDDPVRLQDGSAFLIRVAKTGKVMREKAYWAAQMPQPDPAKSAEVSIEIQLERDSRGKVRVVGGTNLPSRMKLMVGLRNPATGYFGQDKVSVANGSFTTDWFSDRGSRLPAGLYEVSLSSPLAALQPAGVRKVIGKSGENLSGKMVTTSFGSKVIDLKVNRSVK